jgi:hypothetical protein
VYSAGGPLRQLSGERMLQDRKKREREKREWGKREK